MIPIIGFGTYQLKDDEAYQSTLHALKIGYRHIDTAVLYKNEKEVGKAIVDSKVPRNEIFITTKVLTKDQIKGKKNILRSFNKSLQSLQTDYVDLLLLHVPVEEKLIENWLILEELYETKKCKMIGVSNFSIKHLEVFEENKKNGVIKIYPMVNQIELSPFLTRDKLVEYCKNKKIIVEAHTSLTRGNKINDKIVTELAEKYSITNAQLLLKWAQQNGYIILPRSHQKEHIEENFKVLELKITISDDDMNKLNLLNENYGLMPKYSDN